MAIMTSITTVKYTSDVSMLDDKKKRGGECLEGDVEVDASTNVST